jgi:DNA-binding XRE family transcriptional regulator
MRARGKNSLNERQSRNAPHPVDIHVGSRLRERRIVLAMSQQQLAAALGLSFQQVYKYELGKTVSAPAAFMI